MLHFPEEYFKTEVRDGFAISELMKRAWAAQLEVLDRIIAICDKYNLTYYAYFGTLLGAVRHQGYIPWDDDLDIAMPKDDYLTLLEVAKEELPEYYCVLNYYTEPEYNDAFTRITNGHGLDLSADKMQQYHNFPLVAGIDIFPLYYLPRNKADGEVQKSVLRTISETVDLVDAATAPNNTAGNMQIAQKLVELQNITGYSFTTERPIRNQLLILYDQMCQLFDAEESDELTVFPLYMKKGYSVKKEWLEESIRLPFENIMINVPKGYDEVLTKSYRDYMVPRKIRAAHDYPFYKPQLQIWESYIGKYDLRWKEQQRKSTSDNADYCADTVTGTSIPQEWKQKIYTEDGRRKKIILYYSTTAMLMSQGAYATDKLRYVFETFGNNSEVVLWWCPYRLDNPNLSFFEKMMPQFSLEYKQLAEEFKKNNLGIYDDSGDMQRAVAMADAYYGDESDLLQLFVEKDKAVMVQDYELGDLK